MARYRGRKALYEVMSGTRSKKPSAKKLEQLRPPSAVESEPSPAKGGTVPTEPPPKWWKGPKAVQINAGRVEVSISYQLAIAILLGLILLVMIAYRLGQIDQKAANSAARLRKTSTANSTSRTIERIPPPSSPARDTSATNGGIVPAKPTGSNRIVIQTWPRRADLEPVKLHFAQAGIETEIRKIGNMYYLVTGQKYENPGRQGSDGYQALQRIVQIGAKYVAPSGSESFAQKLFNDAYGMKFDD
ncbi:MAG: hypothetical protein JSU70_18855 [Phycisphaerales bacterium]|nr:MAG: hypothetical protein JSU70_18855 [Phycisphaerales bacterium]